MGRLRPGVTHEQTAAELNATMQQQMLDEWQQATAARARRGNDDVSRTLADASMLRAEAGGQGLMDVRRRYAQPLLVLMGCAALLLLTACLNVANLLLSRGAARHKEIAMRLALGAGRGRLVRQSFTESLLIAVAGGVAAIPLALSARDVLLIWRPWGGSPIAVEGGLDWRVLGFSAGVAMVTALLFGLAPALRATRTTLSPVTTRTAAGHASTPLARALVAAQVGISLVLLVAAALFVGTLRNLQQEELGFNADHVLLFRIQPQLNGYTPADIATLYSRLIARIESVPGVRSATLSRHSLLGFSRRATGISVEGAQPSDAGAEVNVVAPNFFETMEIPLLLGRSFNERDGQTAPKVTVVNRRFADLFFAGGNPIGRRLWFGAPGAGEPHTIVGMARDAKYTDVRQPMQPTAYVPFQQDIPGQANIAVRTVGDALVLAPAIRDAVRAIDASLPVFDMKSQRHQAQESVARETMFARVSTVLGAIALLLAAIGLYGVMSYAVVRRTAEIGVRMALGAPRTTVIRMVLRDGVVMTGIGVVLGIPAALAASRASRDVLDQVLFGLQPDNPLAIGAAAAFLLAVALLAGFLPARRASKVDPIVALRCE
jgi:predicted permease